MVHQLFHQTTSHATKISNVKDNKKTFLNVKKLNPGNTGS